MKSPMRPPSFEETKPPVEAPRTIPVFSLRGALSPLLMVPLALPLLIILVAPTTIFDLCPWSLRFTAWVQNLVPFMNMKAHANSTMYPQAALLTHSLTVVIIPVMALVWLWQSMMNYPQLLARRLALGRLALKQHAMVFLVAPPLFLGAVYCFIAIPGDPSFGKGVTTHSRVGFSFLTLCLTYTTSAIMGAQILCLRLFIDTYLVRR
jgi:hypothetical protein